MNIVEIEVCPITIAYRKCNREIGELVRFTDIKTNDYIIDCVSGDTRMGLLHNFQRVTKGEEDLVIHAYRVISISNSIAKCAEEGYPMIMTIIRESMSEYNIENANIRIKDPALKMAIKLSMLVQFGYIPDHISDKERDGMCIVLDGYTNSNAVLHVLLDNNIRCTNCSLFKVHLDEVGVVYPDIKKMKIWVDYPLTINSENPFVALIRPRDNIHLKLLLYGLVNNHIDFIFKKSYLPIK